MGHRMPTDDHSPDRVVTERLFDRDDLDLDPAVKRLVLANWIVRNVTLDASTRPEYHADRDFAAPLRSDAFTKNLSEWMRTVKGAPVRRVRCADERKRPLDPAQRPLPSQKAPRMENNPGSAARAGTDAATEPCGIDDVGDHRGTRAIDENDRVPRHQPRRWSRG